MGPGSVFVEEEQMDSGPHEMASHLDTHGLEYVGTYVTKASQNPNGKRNLEVTSLEGGLEPGAADQTGIPADWADLATVERSTTRNRSRKKAFKQ